MEKYVSCYIGTQDQEESKEWTTVNDSGLYKSKLLTTGAVISRTPIR